MEQTENGCVILKRKEYDELLQKVKDNHSKEIIVSWSYNYMSRRITHPSLNIYGDFELGNKLFTQIQNICVLIKESFDNKIGSYLKSEIINDTRKEFANLKWYERLFFKCTE